jgi:2-dehydro-3-deoxy-D-gluconate 5-dehydrogenase
VPEVEETPRTALVTGASRGVGRALSVELVGVGIEVYGTGRDHEALAATAALCEAPERFHPRVIDVRSHAEVKALVAEPERLDLCFNNAAIMHEVPFLETTVEQVEEMLDVNVVGAFVVMQAAAARMLGAGGGRVIDIASIGSLEPLTGAAGYTASKHGLAGLSKTLAAALGGESLQVTTVYLGTVDTEIHPASLPREGFMEPAEVARTLVATLLASGQTVRISELHLRTLTGI